MVKTSYIIKDCLLARDALEYTDTFSLGQSVFRDAAARLTLQQKSLQWIVDNFEHSHPANILAVAKEGLKYEES